jgi:tetratricopeptide (TPR) repeat protein
MDLKALKITLLLAILLTGIRLNAQDYNAAANAYNEGVAMYKVDPYSSIVSFENCIKICEQVGDTTEDIKLKSLQTLAMLYTMKADSLLTKEKNINQSLIASRLAVKYAEDCFNEGMAVKAKNLIIYAYSKMGSEFYGKGDYDNAILAFDSLLMIDPGHLNTLYNKALTYKKLNNSEKFAETIDTYIGKGTDQGENTKVDAAKKLAYDYFRIAGSKANQANKQPEALSLLTTAMKYGEDGDIHYQFANIYNKQKKYTEAAENASKGLELETETTPDGKAKYYYELGVAQSGNNETAKACESFKNSMYGPFLEASKAQRTNLKCQ